MSEAINVVELQSRQKRLEKNIKRRKKKMPYTIFGMILCVLIVVFLFEEKAYHLFGTSTKMIAIIGIVSIVIIAVYIILTLLRIRKTNIELKEIGNQLYNILKLNA